MSYTQVPMMTQPSYLDNQQPIGTGATYQGTTTYPATTTGTTYGTTTGATYQGTTTYPATTTGTTYGTTTGTGATYQGTTTYQGTANLTPTYPGSEAHMTQGTTYGEPTYPSQPTYTNTTQMYQPEGTTIVIGRELGQGMYTVYDPEQVPTFQATLTFNQMTEIPEAFAAPMMAARGGMSDMSALKAPATSPSKMKRGCC
eukprot:GHVO01069157.1.p1 GENE.GHVO01069157.1~~GHVO01069157.1.p1  ORF type:complete len:200 (+),score=18.72 GHVO01069157.1:95-694(+)